MKAKIGIIKTVNFNPENYSEVVRNSFKHTIQSGISYKVLTAFDHYFNEYFDLIFESNEGYQKWLESGIDKTIIKVEYDWKDSIALITIADTNFPGPHEFECTEEWTIADCENAIKSKFGIE